MQNKSTKSKGINSHASCLALLVVGVLLCLPGCIHNDHESTLYQQMGGAPVVEQVVDNFINEIVNDERIFTFFKASNVDRFREKMIEHLCYLSDGPCAYTGDSMIDVHANMGVTEADFNRVVDLLVNALTYAGVDHPLQNRLLKRMVPIRPDVIYITR